MNRKRKMLIAIVLVALMLLNCVLPIVQVGAATDTKITFENNLYVAVKNELVRQGIKAAYIDEQRTLIISAEEIAKVTELSLSNSKIIDLTGLEVFTNLSILDLSSNELNKDSNLAVLNAFTLSTLDLSSNAIEDVSMITNLDDIQNLNLHNQKMNIVHIVELDTSNESDQVTEVTYALPQILKRAGYLETEWLVEETTGQAKINWSKFDHENIKVTVAQKTDSSYTPYKSMVTLRIRVSDSTNTLYNSDINMFFVVVDSNERGIHIPDKNMYTSVKEQLTAGQTVNSDLISYAYTSPSSLKRSLYERAYAEPQVLVISIDDIINRIGSLDLSNKRIERLDGIEKFVGLETELDLSGNYIKSIDKLIELQENQIIEEAKLRERVNAQLGLVSETVSEMNSVETAINAENTILAALNAKKQELEKTCEKLEAELADLRSKKAQLEEDKVDITGEIEQLQIEIEEIKNVIADLNSELEYEKGLLNHLKDEKNVLENQLAELKKELANEEADIEKIKSDIADKESEITMKDTEIASKQTDIANKQTEIDSKIEEINKKQEDIDSKTLTIAVYDTQISDINVLIGEKELALAEAQKELNDSSLRTFIMTEKEIDIIVDVAMERIITAINDDSNFTPENGTAAKNGIKAYIVNLLKEVYDSINAHMDEISSLVANDDTTEEELNAEIRELETTINESLNFIENTSVNYDLTKYNASSDTTTLVEKDLRIRVKETTITDLNDKLDNMNNLSALVSQLNEEFKIKVTETTTHLVDEKTRLQTEIDNLTLEIEAEGTGLKAQLDQLQQELDALQNEKAVLEEEKVALEEELNTLKTELARLKEELVAAQNSEKIQNLKKDIAAKEAEITLKQTEIEAKERDIVAIEEEIAKEQPKIEERQKLIEEKQNAIKEKEEAIAEKEKEIQAKIAEIAKIVEQLNAQEESIAQSQLKLEELYKNLESLKEILFSRMARLYQIYNRVDKLASFAIPELKTITAKDYLDLSYEDAKAMFNKQINKISEIESDLTSFETSYLMDKYDIPTHVTTEVEKTVQNPDGTTSKVMVTETKAIENPISTYFNELADATEEWNLANFKYYLTNFREDDTYFSMATYCYLVRLFDGVTTCQANKYIDIEIEKYEFDEEPTDYLVAAKNNYSSIINKYHYNCSGEATNSMLKAFASRMVKASGDVNIYVYLPRLKSVNVNENLIENIDKISELSELRRFYAYDNQIVDISNVNWSNMTKLKVLNLGFNGISNIKPLEVLVNIEELYLQKNLIGGEFDFNVHLFEKLKVLDLSENQINDIEKLIKFLAYEARANGYNDIATFLRNSGLYNVKFNNQRLSMTVDKKFEVDEYRKVELPKIFEQIEEIDYMNTSFGIDSLDGNVTSDGKYVILNTTKEGTHDARVTILNTKNVASFGSGTTCDITYTVGDIIPVTVKITPETADVIIGKTQQFTAEVTGDNVTYTGVTWEVLNGVSAETEISDEGLLTVGADETAETLIVRATSVYDETKAAEVQVTVIKKQVTSITLTPETTTAFKGESTVFTANVEGENLENADKEVTWRVLVRPVTNENGEEVTPRPAEGTTASFENNKLTLSIGPNETIEEFAIEATSKFDTTKVAMSLVTVDERTVTEVKVTPETASVEKGKTQSFTATVNGENLRTEDKVVTYTVTGNTSMSTKITKEGLLTIGADEKAKTLTVTATSNYDKTKSGVATVTVTSPVVNNNLGYTVDEEYVVGVATKTPVDAFKQILTDEYTVIVKENGKEVKTGYIRTGMYVELQDEDGNTAIGENGELLVYEVVVKGDVNSDGVADALDSNLIKALRNEVITLDAVQQRAADIDDNSEIDLLDSKLLLYHRAEVKDYCLDYTK